MLKALVRRRAEDPLVFYNTRVKFDLKAEEASENVWDLLFDYCCFYGHARVFDIRDLTEKLIADYDGENTNYCGKDLRIY